MKKPNNLREQHNEPSVYDTIGPTRFVVKLAIFTVGLVIGIFGGAQIKDEVDFTTHVLTSAPIAILEIFREDIPESIRLRQEEQILDVLREQTVKNDEYTELSVETPQNEAQELQEGIVVKATYYSRAGCINCHSQLIMANGKPLDDNALAVAYDNFPLGTHITLCNQADTICVDAEVTDRMGNKNLNRVDMTPKLFENFAPLSLGVIENLTLYCNDEENCF